MQLIIRKFSELTTEELYRIYRTRFEVFVVEQQCCYQDADEFDPVAIHAWYEEDGEIIAYIRVLPPGATFPEAAIGRVLCNRRRQGIGTRLVREGIDIAVREFGSRVITIEAQCYVREMYEKLGFVQTSEEFLDVGIPHIQMQYTVVE